MGWRISQQQGFAPYVQVGSVNNPSSFIRCVVVAGLSHILRQMLPIMSVEIEI